VQKQESGSNDDNRGNDEEPGCGRHGRAISPVGQLAFGFLPPSVLSSEPADCGRVKTDQRRGSGAKFFYLT
jgi:hypothetical protein